MKVDLVCYYTLMQHLQVTFNILGNEYCFKNFKGDTGWRPECLQPFNIRDEGGLRTGTRQETQVAVASWGPELL